VITEAVEAHYLQCWGPPTRRAMFRRGGYSIEVYKWPVDATNEGVALYATAGVSQHRMEGVPPDHRVEFFVGLNPERDEIASPLAGLALFAFEERVPLGHGHTVPISKPLWPGSRMSAFLILHPVSEILPPLHAANGIHVEFLQVIPIYESEVAYKAEHQTEGLVALWRKANIRFWNPDRSPEPATQPP
jgi:hypothetical protein